MKQIDRPAPSRARLLAGIVALAAAYFVAAKLGLRLAYENRNVTTVWPPTGIAVAALLVWGRRLWPGIALGALVANWSNGLVLPMAAGIAVGNTLAPVVAAHLLITAGFRRTIDRLADVFGLMFVGGFASMTISATCGLLVLLAAGEVDPKAVASTWLVWWIGDAMGVVLVAPAVLTFAARPLRSGRLMSRPAESFLVLASTAVVALALLPTRLNLAFLLLPFASWGALRLEQQGASIVTLIVSSAAISAAVRGHAWAPGVSLTGNLVLLQLFNATVALISFSLAAVVRQGRDATAELRHTTVQLREMARGLEQRVNDRTAELSASEERFRALAQSAPDAIVSADASGTIFSVNPAAERLFGYTAAEMVGRSVTMLMPERYLARHLAAFEQVLNTEESHLAGATLQLHGLRCGGAEFPIDLSPTSWRAAGDTYFTAVIRDVTERVDRERANALVRSAIQAVGEAPDLSSALEAFCDVALHAAQFERASYAVQEEPGALRLRASWGRGRTGLPEEETYTIAAGPRLDALLEARPFARSDTSLPGADAVDRVLEAVGTRSYVSIPARVGARARAVVSFARSRPVAFSAAEIDLLAQLVQGAAGPLEHLQLLDRERALAQRLRALDELRNDFVGMVAHDLRSPLTAISGYADTILVQWERLDDQRKRAFLESITRSANALAALTEEVLEAGRLESGDMPLDPAPFDVGACVVDAAEQAAHEAGASVELRVSSGLPAGFGDAARYRQVVGNLVGNAFKFAGSDEPVVVSVGAWEGNLVVTVADKGPGIQPEDMSRVFDRFTRGRQLGAGDVKGTGLGLYIARLLVEAQGGRIWAESEAGEGATFSFTVPLAGDASG